MQGELRDIHLPDPVSWWPLAPGWYMLLILIIILIILAVYLINRWRHPSIKKMALIELTQIETDFVHHNNTHTLCSDISILLRRVAISYGTRNKEAAITGEAWLKHLNNLCGQTIFTPELSNFLLQAPYQLRPQVAVDQFIAASRQWIELLPRRKRS